MNSAVNQLPPSSEVLVLTPEQAAEEVSRRAIKAAAKLGRRVLIGVAGGPGSGKSTIAADIVGQLNHRIDGSAARVPMDGFHMTQARLTELDLVDKKGAPETFEAANFVTFLEKLKQAKVPVPAPSYSRRIESVVPDAFTIAGNVPILVIEGNYLLLGQSPWDQISDLLDVSVFLDVPRKLVEQRLLKRHAEYGMFSKTQIDSHVANVDLPNYDLVADSKSRAGLVIALETRA